MRMILHIKPIGFTLCMGVSFLMPTHGFAVSKLPVQSVQQSGKCTGIILDEQGEPIIGATVQVKGTSNGAATDLDGRFSLSNIPPGSIIVISYIGMDTKEVKWDGQEIKVTLKEEQHALNELIVTGYGGQQKRATLTTAISKMDNKVLDAAAFSNVGSALQGSVTGLQVVNSSGQPGTAPSITLRGGASITGSAPALIIVDGVERTLSEINPSDIESIEVLKDAASTAIYGARANGGVILVTTKRAQAGTSSINYRLKVGANFKRDDYKFMNARNYLYYNRMGFKRYADAMEGHGRAANVDAQNGYSGRGYTDYTPRTDVMYYDATNPEHQRLLTEEGWEVMDDPYYGATNGAKLIFKDYGGLLEDAIYHNQTLTQDHYLSFSGGNNMGSFVASLGYYNENGVVRNTSFRRFTGSVKGDYQIKPWLKVRAGAQYTWFTKPDSYFGSWSSLFYRTRSQRPTWNPYLADGSPAPGWSSSDGNYMYWNDKLTMENGSRSETFNIGFDLTLIPKHLKMSANGSIYHVLNQNESFNKAYYTQSNPNSINTTRRAYAYMMKDTQIQLNTILNYFDTFAEHHNVDFMLGAEYYDYNYFWMNASTKNSPTDDIPTLNAGADKDSNPKSEKSGNRIESLFGRFNYDYKQKYLLSFTFRYDGNSKLKDNRWGFFPGISLGWNMMEEDFWKESKLSNFISNIKPRISYGSNGNVSGIGDFYIYGIYDQLTNYHGNTAFYDRSLVNTALKWEQSHTFEAGLDLGFFKNRLSLILDYYVRNTSNLLQSVNLPSYLGFSSIQTNLGKLRNQGFEMEVRATPIHLKNSFRWDLSFNLSTVKNTIIQLPKSDRPFNQLQGVEVAAGKVGADGKTPTKWIGGYREGGTLGELYGYSQDHIFRDWDDVKANANKRIDNIAKLYGPGLADEVNPQTGVLYKNSTGWKAIEPGDVCWEDINEDGIINSLDRKVLGNSRPTVTGGWTSTLSYKNLSLFARFDYALGHTIYNDLKARSMGQYQGQFNLIENVQDMWTETNPGASYPAFSYADQLNKQNIWREGSKFFEKASYMALREITLSYTLPKTWIKAMKMANANVYVTGQNLFYLTPYDGASPEAILEGYDYGRYPTPRTLIFGLNVTF